MTVAVGDRVICRNNERDLDIDNGTRGTVRHVHERGIVIETDAHLVRELPAGYVAEHVEHAYALTGHGMQGATVEHATVVASPHDLIARLVLHRALTRPRRHTTPRARQRAPASAGASEYAPATRLRPRRSRTRCWRASRGRCSSVTTKTSRSTNSPPPDASTTRSSAHASGRTTAGTASRPRGRTADRGARSRPARRAARPARAAPRAARRAARPRARQARRRSTRGRVELTERRDALRRDLDRLPDRPASAASAANQDPHLVDRTRLASALAGAEDQLERTLTQRAALARELGDPAAIRERTRRPDQRDRHARPPAHRAAQRTRRTRSPAPPAMGARRARRTTRPQPATQNAGTTQPARSPDTASNTRSPNMATRSANRRPRTAPRLRRGTPRVRPRPRVAARVIGPRPRRPLRRRPSDMEHP